MAKSKLGLAFSGGGARGFAHIGVLKILHQAGIQVDCIGGTSMGGIIAAAYACGIPIDQIEEKALQLSNMRNLIKLIDLSTQRRGLLEGNRIRDYLADLFLDRCFENLPVPLVLPSVDLISTREIVFTSGLVFPAVLATMAVPGLFEPVEIGPYRLVDGGILNNLPIDRVRELGADIVIGIDAQYDPMIEKPWQEQPNALHFPVPMPSFFLDFYRAELIMVAQLTKKHLLDCPPDLLLYPPIPADITMFLGFVRIPEIIAAGEQIAIESLPKIRQLLERSPN